METEFVNRVANSALVTINLEDLFHPGERVVFDMKDHLFMGLILKEKDFREFIKTNDWSQYAGKNVAIICSADAIVPTWAYMLVAANMEPYANFFVYGNLEALETALYMRSLDSINPEDYRDKRIVIKGCSDKPVPVSAYAEITRRLTPVAKSIFYGEPCSTVPVMKKK